jgi:phage-related protein
MLPTRAISWVTAARRDFDDFPDGARQVCLYALAVLAGGDMPRMVKPLRGLGSGILEIAARYKGDAYRVVVDLKSGVDLWVLHAFQKKSHQGSKTPVHEIDLVRRRLRQVRGVHS